MPLSVPHPSVLQLTSLHFQPALQYQFPVLCEPLALLRPKGILVVFFQFHLQFAYIFFSLLQ